MLRRTPLLLSCALAAAGTSREELERDGVVERDGVGWKEYAVDPNPDASCNRLSGVGGTVHDDSSFQIAAYLPEWRYEGANWATICATVTHLILFSIEVAPSGALAALDRLPRPALMREVRAAATAGGTNLQLCVPHDWPMCPRRAPRPRRVARSYSFASAATGGALDILRQWRVRRSARGSWRRCSHCARSTASTASTTTGNTQASEWLPVELGLQTR